MEKRKIFLAIIIVLAFFVGLPLLLQLFIGPGPKPILRPADYITPSHQAAYDKLLAPAIPPSAVDMAFLRALEPTIFTKEKIRFEFDLASTRNQVQPEQVHYTVEHLDIKNLTQDKPHILPIAIGFTPVAMPDENEEPSEYCSDDLAFTYYDLDGQPLPDDKLQKLRQDNQQEYVQYGCRGLKIVYEIHNLDNPQMVGSRLFDSRTLARLESGSSRRHYAENPYDIDYDLRTLHSTSLIWVVDIAYGPLDFVDIPLEKNAEAVFTDAAIRIITEPFTAGYGNTSSTDGLSYYEWQWSEPRDNEYQNIIVALTPQCMVRMLKVQFLDKDGQPIGSIGGLYAYPTVKITNYSPLQATHLRVYRCAGIKRFVLNLGQLSASCPENENIADLMDITIPYVQTSQHYMLNEAIKGATQLNLNLDHSIQLPQDSYYNITAMELLQELKKLHPADAEINIDLDQATLKIGPRPVVKSKWQRFIEWVKSLWYAKPSVTAIP